MGLFVVVFPVWLTLALSDQGMDDANRLLGYDRPAAMWVAQIGTIAALIVGIVLRRKRGQLGVTEDERDQLIARRAIVAAGNASLLTLVVTFLIVLVIFKRVRGEEMIPLDVLVVVVILVGVVWYLTLTTVTLISYKRGK
jgi:predicted histidine transporter YuiF (NhaC family)